MAYNNVAHVSYCRVGLLSYIIRLADKMNRYENLRLHTDIDKGDEAIEDTLRDAINYVCMLVGDLRADGSEVADTKNVKETLKAIRNLASLSEDKIREDASIFTNTHVWEKANGNLGDVPYALYEQDANIVYYMYFAAYLITLYLDRGE